MSRYKHLNRECIVAQAIDDLAGILGKHLPSYPGPTLVARVDFKPAETGRKPASNQQRYHQVLYLT